MTLISVVLTTYNGATRGYLREAVESVLTQTDRDFELLIVDDGSTDATPEMCRSFIGDSRVRYIRKENGGPASARNTGLAESRGELVCFLDDDDAWLPEKLARQRDRFDTASPRPGLVYTAVQVVDISGRPLHVQSHQAGAGFYRRLFFENAVDATSSVMVARDAVRKVGGFREDIFSGTLQMCEDRELWIRIAREFAIVSIDEPLIRYRVHNDKLSAKHDEMEESELVMLRIAVADAPPVIKAETAEIYRQAYSRFALNRFTLGNYSKFREYFRIASTHGSMSASHRLRYWLSYFPFLVGFLRRFLGSPVRL